MMGHNQIGWTMPVGFEEYVVHFTAAKNAWTSLYVALDQLTNFVSQARQSPQSMASPANPPWPTQEELRKMFVDAQAKTIPLMGEYNQLPQDVKSYAPQPGTAQERPLAHR
jgi:hypothetical protein